MLAAESPDRPLLGLKAGTGAAWIAGAAPSGAEKLLRHLWRAELVRQLLLGDGGDCAAGDVGESGVREGQVGQVVGVPPGGGQDVAHLARVGRRSSPSRRRGGRQSRPTRCVARTAVGVGVGAPVEGSDEIGDRDQRAVDAGEEDPSTTAAALDPGRNGPSGRPGRPPGCRPRRGRAAPRRSWSWPTMATPRGRAARCARARVDVPLPELPVARSAWSRRSGRLRPSCRHPATVPSGAVGRTTPPQCRPALAGVPEFEGVQQGCHKQTTDCGP